jgi:hypothetical protein
MELLLCRNAARVFCCVVDYGYLNLECTVTGLSKDRCWNV